MPGKPRLLTHDGHTLPISQWATKAGIAHTTIRQRIDDFGWSVADALTIPPDGRFRSSRSGRPGANIPRPCPVLKRHAGGQAMARWSTRGASFYRYFGVWGSDAAKSAYLRFSLEWGQGLAEIKSAKGEIFVMELADAYLGYAKSHYSKNGRQTGEYASVVAAVRVLVEIAGDKSTGDFRPDDLRLCQAQIVARGLSRSTVNSHCGRIVRAFAWGVAHTTTEGRPFVPADILASLREVEKVAAHRTVATEPRIVTAVPWKTVEKTLPHLHTNQERRAVLEAVVRVHWLTGIRSSALLAMRPADIDRSITEWRYVVGSQENKNAHRGRDSVFFFGPQVQSILTPLLATTGEGERLFRFRHASTGADVLIDKDLYGRLVKKACERAGIVPAWHPHQLRHSRATEVQRIYESDSSAAAAIGDTEEVTRRVYLDPSEVVRRRIARETG